MDDYSLKNREICLNKSKFWRKAEPSFSTFLFLFAVSSPWKANKKTNLMISKHLKSDEYSPRNSELWLKESKSWRKALCALYNTYLVTPIPCYLLQAAWLVRFRNCPYPQPYSRAKECYEAAWSKTPKRAAWVRVKWTHCILFDLCVFKPQLMSICYAA